MILEIFRSGAVDAAETAGSRAVYRSTRSIAARERERERERAREYSNYIREYPSTGRRRIIEADVI